MACRHCGSQGNKHHPRCSRPNSLRDQIRIEQHRETASGAYMPSPREIERMKRLIRAENDAKKLREEPDCETLPFDEDLVE